MMLGLSIIAGLAVVLLANARSSRQQSVRVALEAQRFADLLGRLNGHFRRAELTVDWQKVDAAGDITETGLLVRQFALEAQGEEPLPVERVVIPGSAVRIDALLLTFTGAVIPDFSVARDTRLILFGHVYGNGESRSDYFSFMARDQVPAAARVHGDRTTHGETLFWNYAWEFIRGADQQGQPPKSAVQVTWLPAASRVLRRGLLYTAIASADGVTISESDDRRILNDIRTSIEQQDSAPRPN